jgi:hypothetical protein
MTVLREQLLGERAVAMAGAASGALAERLRALGARVEIAPALEEAELEAWVRRVSPLHALVFDGAGAFGRGGPTALQQALEQAWVATRAVAAGAFIASPESPGGTIVQAGGKLVLLAPAPSAGALGVALAAALENLARTLSVEWARHRVSACAVVRGAAVSEVEVAELVAYLVSPAGDYFSGCRFELGSLLQSS